ncbi:MAG TPA: tetratricopeptide repeat protein [Stellaceae bacterium]
MASVAAADATIARADDAAVTANRALSAAAHNKYEDAINLYTETLRSGDLSESDRAALEDKRGVAYASTGQVEKAIADFDSVVRRKPHYLFAYFNRGAALDGMGRYAAAIADFDAVLKYDSGSGAAYFMRGQAQFHARRFAASASDFAHDVEVAPADALAVAWLDLAQRRAGKDDRHALAKNAAAVDLKQWPGPVVALYLGKLTAKQLMAAAANPNADIQTDRQCQGNFYIGQAALLDHHPAEARRLFTEVNQHCPVTLAEYIGARAELTHLK